jgi:hypothetical protein
VSAADGWTIPEAVAEFERAGMPVDPDRFRIAVIRGVRIRRVGEMRQPPGSKGGRGQVLYDIGQLQRLHTWYLEGCQITKQEP